MANNNKHTGPNVPALRFPEFSGEWESYSLGDIADVTKLAGYEFTKYVVYEDEGSIIALRGLNCKNGSLILDDVKYIDHSDLSKLTRSKLFIGDILFTYVGTVGEVAIITDNDKYYLAPNVSRIRVCEGFDSQFVKHLLSSNRFYKQIVLPLIATSSQPALSMENIRKFQINVPCTIKEQKQIATVLSLLEERINTQSKIIEEQETLLKSLADRLFSQNIHSCQLSELVDIIKGKQLNADTLSEEGDYYVMNGGITPSGYYSEYNVPAGSISISEGGNSCGYVQFNEKPFWSGGHCYSLRPKTAIVDYKYIYYFLKAKQTDVMALRIGSGLPNIQKKDIEKFTVSFPPLQQQKMFVKALDAVSGKIDTEKLLLEEYRLQKDYLLSRMFI